MSAARRGGGLGVVDVMGLEPTDFYVANVIAADDLTSALV